jgi:hypothetical protein
MGKIMNIRDALKDDAVALARAERLAKGAQDGHSFYGNQHTDGEGGSGTEEVDEPDDLTKGDGSNQYVSKGGVENVKAHLEVDGRNATFQTIIAPGKTAKDDVVKARTEAHDAMRAKGFIGKITSATIDSAVHDFQHQYDGRTAKSESSWGKEPSIKITITRKG